jgi:Domain of Unknown Function (DUF1080)
MKTTSIITIVCLVTSVSTADIQELCSKEKAAGFMSLFNNVNLDGWRTYKMEKPAPRWQAIDGIIALSAEAEGADPANRVDLISDKKFTNFELRFQFKIADEGNSGVMWHVTEEFQYSFETGPEYQVLDPFSIKKYPAEIKKGNISGAFYDIIPSKQEWSKKGDWNDGSIKVVDTKITFTINGITSADIDTTSDNWKKCFTKSKFIGQEFVNYNKQSTGHICLQDHGDQVGYRNIRIREIN